MARILLIALAALALLLGAGFTYLGLFPPDPPTREISRTLPNERFQGR